MKWIVIALAYGDGSSDYGKRVWSHEFQSKAAALEALAWLDSDPSVRVKLIEDWLGKPEPKAVAA